MLRSPGDLLQFPSHRGGMVCENFRLFLCSRGSCTFFIGMPLVETYKISKVYRLSSLRVGASVKQSVFRLELNGTESTRTLVTARPASRDPS